MAVERGVDVGGFVGVLVRRWLLVVVVLVVVPGLAFVVASRSSKVFESSVLMQVQPQSVDVSLFSSAGGGWPVGGLNATARLITTSAVAREAAGRLSGSVDPRSLLGVVSTAVDSSGFITITARAGDPRRAALVANAFAQTVVSRRARGARGALDAAIAQVKEQLVALPRGDREGRRQLSVQLQRFRALRAAQGSNAQVVEPAVPVFSAVSPRVRRTVVLAVVCALLAALGLVALVESADRKLRDPEALEAATGRPLLAAIPRSAFSGRPPTAVEDDAFHTLRSSLRYFHVDRVIDSVIVTSPMKGDGKTTVATRLAVAAAAAGGDVILVDADMRRPQVAQRLGLADHHDGLAAVLVGHATLEDALVEHQLDREDDISGRLRVLPAGVPPPNPAQLLSSLQMRALLDSLRDRCDLVIIDTNPVLAVSDSLPLYQAAAGVILVARMNQTSRDSLTKLLRVIQNAGGTPLGVVATNTPGAGLYGHNSYDYNTKPTNNRNGHHTHNPEPVALPTNHRGDT
jgi:capsular exopolysaccharide synthesis family protein